VFDLLQMHRVRMYIRVYQCALMPRYMWQEGEVMGGGGGDRLILADDDEHEDEIRMGTGLGETRVYGLGELGYMSPPEVEDEDDDAEELLMRLQEQSERSWSRSLHCPSFPAPSSCPLSSLPYSPTAPSPRLLASPAQAVHPVSERALELRAMSLSSCTLALAHVALSMGPLDRNHLIGTLD